MPGCRKVRATLSLDCGDKFCGGCYFAQMGHYKWCPVFEEEIRKTWTEQPQRCLSCLAGEVTE